MTNEVHQIDGKFYQEAQVIMLPTKDMTFIGKYVDTDNLVYNSINDFPRGLSQHLYIISDEEAKSYEYNWIYNISTKRIYKINPVDTKRDNEKVIIATTDKSLQLKAPVVYSQEDGLPRPSNEFIQAYCKSGGDINKVLVEIEKGEYYNYISSSDGTSQEESGGFKPNKIKIAPDNTITIRRIPEENHWDKIFTILRNPDVDMGTKEAMIREKYNAFLK